MDAGSFSLSNTVTNNDKKSWAAPTVSIIDLTNTEGGNFSNNEDTSGALFS